MNRWSIEQANEWHAKHPWMVGANYVTSNAVNALEMWRKYTFDPELLDHELSLAASVGMNTVRVFLSYTVWHAEGKACLDTFEKFLQIADSKGISVMPILFDDCAFGGRSDPVYGPQPDPICGVHNSRWVPSPGFVIQDDPASASDLREYVNAFVGTFKNDSRIIAWDLYNEPGNSGRKLECLPLLVNAFRWARDNAPTQPLSSCIYCFDESWTGLNSVIAELSDVINLHIYLDKEKTLKLIDAARSSSNRPVIVTEWMHRPNGSTIIDLLPYFAENKIHVWQWGLVNGRTQTHLNWNPSFNDGNSTARWQHDIFHNDGTPYDISEIELMRKLTCRI